MSSPLQYKVYLRIKGESKKQYMANFRKRVDSINYGYDISRGAYKSPDITVICYNLDNKIMVKYVEGTRTGGAF